ncbi:MAG TPA: TolC family protein, partial [Novosphingobium sp.]|nr:TolC family protein [Novosphingobium sp.]
EGGALKGKYRASLAGEDMAIAAYNRAVIGAVKEVADALSQVATRAEDAEAQHAITRGLDETLRLDHVRLASGLAGRLDALAAGQRLLSARQAETDIIADGLVQRIRLAVALGGGFAPSAATATASADTPFMRPVSMRSGAPVQTVAPAHTAAR